MRQISPRKSISVMFFGLATGVYLVSTLAGVAVPSLMISAVLGMFWHYLTLNQNLALGSFRLVLAFPNIYQRCLIASTQSPILLDFIQNRSSTGNVIPLWFTTFFIATVPMSAILGYLVGPYVFYRVFRRVGFYDRIPWRGT